MPHHKIARERKLPVQQLSILGTLIELSALS